MTTSRRYDVVPFPCLTSKHLSISNCSDLNSSATNMLSPIASDASTVVVGRKCASSLAANMHGTITFDERRRRRQARYRLQQRALHACRTLRNHRTYSTSPASTRPAMPRTYRRHSQASTACPDGEAPREMQRLQPESQYRTQTRSH